MSKKGFTIVELAIVLVVIGIILGMAVKGKALVDAARMRAEVTKMNKFEAAVATYYARTNYLPEEDASGNILKEVFIDKELLTNRDFEVRVGTGYWTANRCNTVSDGAAVPKYNFEHSATGSNVCVIITTAGTGSTALSVDSKLMCNIEVMKDDENLSSGEGRGYAGILTDTGSIVYRNCDNATFATTTYAFRAF